MAHLAARRTRAEMTPLEWLPLGGQLASQTNTWSERLDVVAYVGEGAGGATACWIPATAEMELNTKVAFGEECRPEDVGDFTERSTHFAWPVAAGAVLHESGHARHTLFDLQAFFDVPDWRIKMVAEWLEESRIEARMLEHFPANRSFLRASTMSIVMGDLDLDELRKQGAFGVASMLLLTCARVDARILDPGDVIGIRLLAETLFGRELFDKLRSVWVRAQDHRDDRDFEPLHELASEYVALLAEHGDIPITPEEHEAGLRFPLPDWLQDMIEEIIEEIEDAEGAIEILARGEAARQEEREAWEREASRRGSVAKEEKENKDAAERIFAKGTGPEAVRSTSSRLREKRAPTANERAAAIKVAQMLDKARYQDRVVTPVKRTVPPGRLQTRQAIQRKVEIRQTGMSNVRAWHAEQRRHVEDPTLKIGILTDISGSMGGAMLPMAVTNYVFAEAGRRIQARTASIYYGSGVFPVLRPGQITHEVSIYTAPDGTEKFNDAAKALDGALGLLHGSGARLVVITSDMVYTGDEDSHAKRWVKRWVDAGVAVLILPFDQPWGLDEYDKMGARVIGGNLDPAGAAIMLGQECVKEIEKASKRRVG